MLVLAYVYLPLQQALVNFLHLHRHLDLKDVLTYVHQRRLLAPQHMLRVLETLELDGVEAAAVRLLVFVYHAESERVSCDSSDVSKAESLLSPPRWLDTLLEAVDRHGGQGFRESLGPDVRSAATWNRARGRSSRCANTFCLFLSLCA